MIHRAGVAHRGLQHCDLIGVEVRVADEFVEDPQRRARQLLAGQRDQHGALALAQVVASGLAGLGLVAEDAEDVIAQLERDAERQAEIAERAHLRQGALRQGGAEGEGRLDAVLRRLVDDDAMRALERLEIVVVAPGDLVEHVEVLPERHLAAHGRELGSRRGRR